MIGKISFLEAMEGKTLDVEIGTQTSSAVVPYSTSGYTQVGSISLPTKGKWLVFFRGYLAKPRDLPSGDTQNHQPTKGQMTAVLTTASSSPSPSADGTISNNLRIGSDHYFQLFRYIETSSNNQTLYAYLWHNAVYEGGETEIQLTRRGGCYLQAILLEEGATT